MFVAEVDDTALTGTSRGNACINRAQFEIGWLFRRELPSSSWCGFGPSQFSHLGG